MRWSVLLLVVGLAGVGPSQAAPPKGKAPAPAFDPAARAAAAQKGLGWLEKHALGLGEIQGTPTVPFTLAFTGLDVLLDAGEYAPAGARARLLATVRARLAAYLEVVERRLADPAQLPDGFGMVDSSKLVQYVWPLSLSAWLHSECVARNLDAPSARAHLKRAARVLEEAQMRDGGWGHGRIRKPEPELGPTAPGVVSISGYPATLLAPTNCAAAAIGFLEDALPRPESDSAKRAVAHYKACILANGNFPYDLRQRTADQDLTGVGRTAGAIVAMEALGVSHTETTFSCAAAFLREHWDVVGEGHGSPVRNLVFGALAARILGPEDQAAFEAIWIPPVLKQQAADGALDCACTKRRFGSTCDSPAEKSAIPTFQQSQRAYVTALTTFVLLLDKRLPRILDPRAPATKTPSPVTPR